MRHRVRAAWKVLRGEWTAGPKPGDLGPEFVAAVVAAVNGSIGKKVGLGRSGIEPPAGGIGGL